MRKVNPDDLLRFVETQTIHHIRCSDCECFGEECFNQQQAAKIYADAGWLVLGDSVRVVCNRCGAYYPTESIKKIATSPAHV